MRLARRMRGRAAGAALMLAVAVVAGAVLGGQTAPRVEPASAASVKAPLRARAKVPTYRGLPCPNPVGHVVKECRLAVHGTPDLSRRRWARLFDREVTIGVEVKSLVGNPAAGGAADWPLVDSLGQPMGRLQYDDAKGRLTLVGFDGTPYRVAVLKVRGHGCAASTKQMKTYPLMQIIAPKATASGGQAFLDEQALAPGSDARLAFDHQLGGGTGCGPSGPERGRVRPLRDPRVGAASHTRLSNGELNTVTEYDAKPLFGGTVYFMTNTTQVRVGGIARGMIRVGTPVATVDRFKRCDPKPDAGDPVRCGGGQSTLCDPSSDGTLTWRYVSIRTGRAARPRLYGWIPKRCG